MECMVDLTAGSMLVALAALGTLSSVLMYLTPSSASRLGPTFSGSPLFTLNDLPRNVAAPVSGVICLWTDEEMPSLAAKMLAKVLDSACFREC